MLYNTTEKLLNLSRQINASAQFGQLDHIERNQMSSNAKERKANGKLMALLASSPLLIFMCWVLRGTSPNQLRLDQQYIELKSFSIVYSWADKCFKNGTNSAAWPASWPNPPKLSGTTLKLSEVGSKGNLLFIRVSCSGVLDNDLYFSSTNQAPFGRARKLKPGAWRVPNAGR